MQVRFFTVRSLPISGERNRHERASFVDPGIERGDERWLSVPLAHPLYSRSSGGEEGEEEGEEPRSGRGRRISPPFFLLCRRRHGPQKPTSDGSFE